MLQKEVAERLMAKPSTKEYGVPSVLLQSCATIRKMMTLKPAEFHPRPKIDSMVIRIDFSHEPLQASDGTPLSFPLFQRIVRTTFNQRRKTILNTLSSISLGTDGTTRDKAATKALAEAAIHNAGLQSALRPEVLDLQDFIRLTKAFASLEAGGAPVL